MKATNLRIGNWVKSKLHGGLETEVFSVFHNSVKLGCNPLALYNEDEIEPIDLTHEWLIKFDFKNLSGRDEEEFYIKDKFQLELMFLSEQDTGFYYYSPINREDVRIKYVHQLQNIYCSQKEEELTIKSKYDK